MKSHTLLWWGKRLEMLQEVQQKILLQYRLTYLAETEVNWCPALGTVLANDEIINGVSERGGHPVIRKKMTQWSMRISAYAERLLQGLDTIDWSESIKESQRNWIGKSVGALVKFSVLRSPFSGEPTTDNRQPSRLSSQTPCARPWPFYLPGSQFLLDRRSGVCFLPSFRV